MQVVFRVALAILTTMEGSLLAAPFEVALELLQHPTGAPACVCSRACNGGCPPQPPTRRSCGSLAPQKSRTSSLPRLRRSLTPTGRSEPTSLHSFVCTPYLIVAPMFHTVLWSGHVHRTCCVGGSRHHDAQSFELLPLVVCTMFKARRYV